MPRIPERPTSLVDLDLMKRLKAYAEGRATWHAQDLGSHERAACEHLHSNLVIFIEKCLQPLMDRTTAREMQAFTMHDRGHGMKVAHLMWHVIAPTRRDSLSPGEIALLISAAHLHDLGMGLSDDDRAARLKPDSDLWDKLDPQSSYLNALDRLSAVAEASDSIAIKAEALYQIQQAQEALLCADARDRHATKERYAEILATLAAIHEADEVNIPNIRGLLSFDGDSYESKLIDICVSHNQDAHTRFSIATPQMPINGAFLPSIRSDAAWQTHV